MSVIWWEKTVEYKFVQTVATSNNSFLAPLDGTQEKAGDAILAFKGKWILIEFKRDETTIQSEESKFNDYQLAKTALSNSDRHHHIIYGHLEGSDKSSMKLAAKTYFSKKALTLEKLLTTGIDIAEFITYLEKFTAFKKTSRSGTVGVPMEEFSIVTGVTSDGNVSQCLKLSEFQHALELTTVNENTLTNIPKGPR